MYKESAILRLPDTVVQSQYSAEFLNHFLVKVGHFCLRTENFQQSRGGHFCRNSGKSSWSKILTRRRSDNWKLEKLVNNAR